MPNITLYNKTNSTSTTLVASSNQNVRLTLPDHDGVLLTKEDLGSINIGGTVTGTSSDFVNHPKIKLAKVAPIIALEPATDRDNKHIIMSVGNRDTDTFRTIQEAIDFCGRVSFINKQNVERHDQSNKREVFLCVQDNHVEPEQVLIKHKLDWLTITSDYKIVDGKPALRGDNEKTTIKFKPNIDRPAFLAIVALEEHSNIKFNNVKIDMGEQNTNRYAFLVLDCSKLEMLDCEVTYKSITPSTKGFQSIVYGANNNSILYKIKINYTTNKMNYTSGYNNGGDTTLNDCGWAHVFEIIAQSYLNANACDINWEASIANTNNHNTAQWNYTMIKSYSNCSTVISASNITIKATNFLINNLGYYYGGFHEISSCNIVIDTNKLNAPLQAGFGAFFNFVNNIYNLKNMSNKWNATYNAKNIFVNAFTNAYIVSNSSYNTVQKDGVNMLNYADVDYRTNPNGNRLTNDCYNLVKTTQSGYVCKLFK